MAETTRDKVITYLLKCKSPRTNEQIAKGTKSNINTVKRVLGELISACRVDWWPKGSGKVYSVTETERSIQEWYGSLERVA